MCVEGSVEVSALATQQPNCIEATISEGSNVVIVRVEREFLVEVMGEDETDRGRHRFGNVCGQRAGVGRTG